jgi:glycosyltransferase involved in cell wall biosynthesis
MRARSEAPGAAVGSSRASLEIDPATGGSRLMRLSIAMATWNGARYLREQLDSFRAQCRLPDELVVCDDHSTDGTPAILEEFRRTAPLPVNVLINPKQMGYVWNFEQVVGMCDGDVILLSDQDDVWLPEKLAEHEAVYRSRPEVGMAFSDGTIVGLDPTASRCSRRTRSLNSSWVSILPC